MYAATADGDDTWQRTQAYMPGLAIAGGTDQVLRNILGERVLGLPPEPRADKGVPPARTVHAHCDLPCGVYDPAQARIEAESVKASQEKYQDENQKPSETQVFKSALPRHQGGAGRPGQAPPVGAVDRLLQARAPRRRFPELHDTFWKATKAAGDAKKREDPAQGQQLLDAIAEIDKIFWETKK